MSDRLAWIAQGVVGVGCIIAAVVWLADPKQLLAYTAVSGFGFSLLGNLKTGPNQVSVSELEKLAKVQSVPPSAPK